MRLPFLLLPLVSLSLGRSQAQHEFDFADLDSPAHEYWTRELEDPFSAQIGKLESGGLALDRSSELAFITSLLKAFDVPVSSQLLVFSTTSLQLRLISPRNPRAIYFNEDLYIGFIPGGQIEIVSIDPSLGAIFYIFDVPRAGVGPAGLSFDRSRRCMNCHVDTQTREVPGLTISSVVPGPRGGSMDSFRSDLSGHQIPLADRLGGWHVTGEHQLGQHWGNLIGNFVDGDLVTEAVPPGERFDFARFPAKTSDILAHLLLEHQVGFLNRVIAATYRARAYEFARGEAALTEVQKSELDRVADELVEYLLFSGEAALPESGIAGDVDLIDAFMQKRAVGSEGRSLRDLQLRSRIFTYRCSYMIYSKAFAAMPETVRDRVWRRLDQALSVNASAPGKFDHIPAEEKLAIRSILRSTDSGVPESW